MNLVGDFLFTCSDTFAVECIVYPQIAKKPMALKQTTVRNNCKSVIYTNRIRLLLMLTTSAIPDRQCSRGIRYAVRSTIGFRSNSWATCVARFLCYIFSYLDHTRPLIGLEMSRSSNSVQFETVSFSLKLNG